MIVDGSGVTQIRNILEKNLKRHVRGFQKSFDCTNKKVEQLEIENYRKD